MLRFLLYSIKGYINDISNVESNLETYMKNTKKWYFTFGCGTEDPHRNCYTVIEAESYESARNEMFNRFGSKWAFQYSEDDWMINPQEDEMYKTMCRLQGLDTNRTKPISQAELYNLTRI